MWKYSTPYNYISSDEITLIISQAVPTHYSFEMYGFMHLE